jgi:hypothetical protein
VCSVTAWLKPGACVFTNTVANALHLMLFHYQTMSSRCCGKCGWLIDARNDTVAEAPEGRCEKGQHAFVTTEQTGRFKPLLPLLLLIQFKYDYNSIFGTPLPKVQGAGYRVQGTG